MTSFMDFFPRARPLGAVFWRMVLPETGPGFLGIMRVKTRPGLGRHGLNYLS